MILKVIDEVALTVFAQVFESDVVAVGSPFEVEQAAFDTVNLLPVLASLHHPSHANIVVTLHQNVSVTVQSRLVQIFGQQIVPLLNFLFYASLLCDFFVESTLLWDAL